MQGPQGDPTTVNGKSGSSITLNADDVGALAKTAKAADSAKLGGNLPSHYATAAAVQSAQSTADTAKSRTIINLLRPTLQTTTLNGITCTNNGDGTYTLSGTSTELTEFILIDEEESLRRFNGKKVVGVPKNNKVWLVNWAWDSNWQCTLAQYDNGDGFIFEFSESSKYFSLRIGVETGTTLDNFVVKPMVCDDENATYEDFISYDNSFVTRKDILPIEVRTGDVSGDLQSTNKIIMVRK